MIRNVASENEIGRLRAAMSRNNGQGLTAVVEVVTASGGGEDIEKFELFSGRKFGANSVNVEQRTSEVNWVL